MALASAARAEQPVQTVAERASLEATVQKIDAKKRELSLKDEQGNDFMVQVPKDVTRFDAIKVGDRVHLDYYQSAALSLKKSGEPAVNQTALVEPFTGNLPGGLVGSKITASVEVVNVDAAAGKVTVKGPNGALDTVNVNDPALQPQLGRLKKGDRIQLSYSEALAISVTPKGKE